MTKGKFFIVNIIDFSVGNVAGMTVSDLRQAIFEFSSIDPHVESFLKDNAEEFAKQHKSVTYLVFSRITMELLGYFTLIIKPITVEIEKISRTTERAFKKTGRLDKEMNTYTAAAYLIGQLGRNFSPSLKSSISGDELLELALKRLKSIQRNVGGTIVFLEAQSNEKLLSFYGSNGFRALDSRMAASMDGSPLELVQLFKVL